MSATVDRDQFVPCVRCDGTGERVECIDDLCHAEGHCMHGNNTCELCDGWRRISRELRDRWTSRESFEAVGLPPADLRFRGFEVEDED